MWPLLLWPLLGFESCLHCLCISIQLYLFWHPSRPAYRNAYTPPPHPLFPFSPSPMHTPYLKWHRLQNNTNQRLQTTRTHVQTDKTHRQRKLTTWFSHLPPPPLFQPGRLAAYAALLPALGTCQSRSSKQLKGNCLFDTCYVKAKTVNILCSPLH